MIRDPDEAILAAWLDGSLDPDGCARLASRMAQDPHLARRLSALSATELALRLAHGRVMPADEMAIRICARLPPRRSETVLAGWRSRWLAVAGLAAAIALAVILERTWATPTGPVAAARPLLLDPALVSPASRDGGLEPGSRITTAGGWARIRLDTDRILTLRPYSQVVHRGAGAGWTLEHGAITLISTGIGADDLSIRTAQATARITGGPVLLEVATSGTVSTFAVTTGEVDLADDHGRRSPLAAGQAIHCRASSPWISATYAGTPQRIMGDILYDEPAFMAYLEQGPLLAHDATERPPGPLLDPSWWGSAIHADDHLRAVIGDGGQVTCPPGSGTLRIDLPRISETGLRLGVSLRIMPRPGGPPPRLSTRLFPGATLPEPTTLAPQAPPMDIAAISGRWLELDLAALRVGRTLDGIPVWETRLAIGRTVLYDWSAGAWPTLTWTMADAGIDLRGWVLLPMEGPSGRIGTE